jgi:hypothetical protein
MNGAFLKLGAFRGARNEGLAVRGNERTEGHFDTLRKSDGSCCY